MKNRIPLLITLLGLVGIGCSGPTEPVNIATIQVTAPSTTLASGATVQLTAAALNKNGKALSDRAVTWSSSNQTIATVSSTGLVTAGNVLGGNAEAITISASAEGITGTASLAINPVPVTRIDIINDSLSLTAGDSVSLTATVRGPGNELLTGRTIEWVSLDPSSVSVSTNGLVKTTRFLDAQARNTRVVARVGVAADTGRITILPLPVSSVRVLEDSMVLSAREKGFPTVELLAASGETLEGRTVTWESRDTSIVSATASGAIVGGLNVSDNRRKTEVVAKIEGKTDSLTVVLKPIPVSSIRITPANSILLSGVPKQFTAEFIGIVEGQEITLPEKPNYSWFLGRPGGCKVSGTVTGQGLIATITASLLTGTLVDTCAHVRVQYYGPDNNYKETKVGITVVPADTRLNISGTSDVFWGAMTRSFAASLVTAGNQVIPFLPSVQWSSNYAGFLIKTSTIDSVNVTLPAYQNNGNHILGAKAGPFDGTLPIYVRRDSAVTNIQVCEIASGQYLCRSEIAVSFAGGSLGRDVPVIQWNGSERIDPWGCTPTVTVTGNASATLQERRDVNGANALVYRVRSGAAWIGNGQVEFTCSTPSGSTKALVRVNPF